jgi:ubiquinone/menaquinone biosynthesis C-methylase UbiE
MSFSKKQILDHYRNEAIKHGQGDACTIQDPRTRRLERDAICSYLRNGQKIMEVGCGNGYVAEAIVQRFNVELDAFDFSPNMIDLAKQRKIEKSVGSVHFSQMDVLNLNVVESYDLIFTERVLQNLLSWNDQKIALSNIVRALKANGEFIMLESFLTGMNELNAARKELDLQEIGPPWHNIWFDEQNTITYMSEISCPYVDQNVFLSGYYFGSRVLLPAIMPKGKPVASASKLNDYFCHLPPWGDFCPMKILRFQKI